jgi:exopolysaccharide biosynthesis polyprenyl glycosylphosphotransferase
VPSTARAERRSSTTWLPGYVRRLAAGDLAAITASAAAGLLVRFDGLRPAGLEPSTVALVLSLPVLWVGFLVAFRAYEPRFLGVGSEEHTRVLRAAVFTLALVATASWGFDLGIARGFVVVALPLAAVLTLVWRYAARRHLHARRAQGECMQSVLLVGHEAGVLQMLGHLGRSRHHGFEVVGALLTRGAGGGGAGRSTALAGQGVPVLGDLDDVAEVARREDVDAVVVLPGPLLDGPAVRQLGWDLEHSRAELMLAPAVAEMIGPRVAIRPVNGLPLLHLNRPEHTGARRIAKALVDRSAALAGLAVLALPMLAVAAAVRLDSPGPALYRQERVGKLGRPFAMLKFRSMVTEADALLDQLHDHSEGNGVLFKMRADPRVTRVGRFLRAYSLDELPQLINVLVGQMSLVGPRPPLAAEVARYGDDVHRRLLVKPGLTGLWQINGRSDLSWEESVRLDLRYVENWSFAFDFVILWKTFRAVVARHGAY